jgi:hypothetical protein
VGSSPSITSRFPHGLGYSHMGRSPFAVSDSRLKISVSKRNKNDNWNQSNCFETPAPGVFLERRNRRRGSLKHACLDETGETLGAFTVGFVEAIIHLSHPPKIVSSNLFTPAGQQTSAYATVVVFLSFLFFFSPSSTF